MLEPKLYIIATPLGNRNDITLRAIAILTELDWIFAEDSRETMKLLEIHGIKVSGKHVQSFASHNMKEATRRAIQVLKEGKAVGLVSDRGTPAISDPGALLVRRAREENIPVVPIPGPSSVTALLSVTGWDTDRFVFLGFLPTSEAERGQWFDRVADLGWPICFFESPKRVRETAFAVKAKFPEGRLFVGREMTKTFEEYTEYLATELEPENLLEKGEYVLAILPGNLPSKTERTFEAEIALRLGSDKEWAKEMAGRYAMTSKDLYNALQDAKRRKL